MCRQEAHEREHENEPAREGVKEALGVFDAEPLAGQSRDHGSMAFFLAAVIPIAILANAGRVDSGQC